MVIKAISNGFSDLYQSIPGPSLQDKASFVANQAFQTLPWVGLSFILYKQVPTRFQHYCFRLSSISSLLDLPQPLFKIACGMGIICEFKIGSFFSKKLVKASTRSQQLYFLLLTYSTVTFAYDFFKKMLPPKEASTYPTESRPTNFTLGLMGIELALQLSYEPSSTLAGIAFGALLREYRNSLGANTILSWLPQKIAQKARPSIQESIEYIKRENLFNNPKSTAQKCYHVWLNWDFLSRSISSSPMAFLKGMRRGIILTAYLRS